MLKKIAQKSVYKDPWLELFQDEVEHPDGTKGTYAWVNRKDGVGVVVLTHDKKIFMHREHRYVIDDFSWEIPGGGIDEGESPEIAAVRELAEEAGIQVETTSLKKLGVFYPLNSFNTERVTLFAVVVNTVDHSTDGAESGEHLDEQQFVSFEEALSMIDSGKVNDAFTANAVQLAIRRFESLL